MSGTRPTFTPIISNPALLYTRTCSYVTQGVPATYTGIFCANADLFNWVNIGAYTLDNYQFLNPFAVTPRPFIATFGDQPAPTTVATNTVVVTQTATNTAFAPIQPAATTTVTSASATTTHCYLVPNAFKHIHAIELFEPIFFSNRAVLLV
ncbi:hypothetical protein J4E82_004139 [Alternaria postmessia]|uniref:uncharacterized protein n=1 Tax=Alternaria postmessia TaxID=1187938 RepID=UPI00222449C5|nr:uncharacterized protein J4E82_004139 [Alternaria postmessia]KAI5377056.1 hypothetical protein J4E82_004139 [Alternaria postmessia]